MKAIVYTSPHCVECNVLKRFLHDYKIEHEIRDCKENSQYLEEVQAMGFLGVPVTVIGDRKIEGLNPDAILEALGRKTE